MRQRVIGALLCQRGVTGGGARWREVAIGGERRPRTRARPPAGRWPAADASRGRAGRRWPSACPSGVTGNTNSGCCGATGVVTTAGGGAQATPRPSTRARPSSRRLDMNLFDGRGRELAGQPARHVGLDSGAPADGDLRDHARRAGTPSAGVPHPPGRRDRGPRSPAAVERRRAAATASTSASTPSPGLRRDAEARPGRRARSPCARRASSDRSCCRPRSAAPSARPTPSSTRITAAIIRSRSGCEASMTCRMRSASATSSSVARNAATSACGSRSMKPTVSDTSSSRPSGRRTCRTSGSSVTKSASEASASACVSRLNSVVLPALV